MKSQKAKRNNKEQNPEYKVSTYTSTEFINNLNIYTLIIGLINLFDFAQFSYYQRKRSSRFVFFQLIAISLIQLVDYIVLVVKNLKRRIYFFDLAFCIYSLMIISIVMCIVKFGVDVAHQHYDFKAVFRYKLSSPAFYRGLILVQKQIKEPVKKQKFKISGKKAVLILTFNLLMNIIIILFPLICFVLFFTGLFMLFGYDTLDTIYFVIVSLSSVGYGDITFKDESYGPWGKILTMVFIISAIIYVPIELGNIIDNIKVKIPMIVQKYYSAGPSKCFFELGRRMKLII
ncbi:Ion_transport 2 and transmembrane domain-containing protein [Hexamita inflata]|uniref:Ion_transport 2 and transmembrane domain-containing protein n=1 Tax=Hexamita inflata TaxID=28002 RepID=A0ABP1HHF9_9EUKA